MTITMRRKISRLATEHYRVRGLGMMYSIFNKYPEAKDIDNQIFVVFNRMERIGFDNPRKYREKDKDYFRRLRNIFSKHEKSFNEKIEKLFVMIEEESTPKNNKEVEH